MSIRLDPVVMHARFYEGDVDVTPGLYCSGSGYQAHCIVIFLDNGYARLSGLDKRVRLSQMRELKRKLKEAGVKTIGFRRKETEHVIDLTKY